MRRVALAIVGTIAGLVGLLTFKTHAQPVAAQVVATSPATPGSATGGTPSTAAAPQTTTPSTTSSSPSSSGSSSSSSAAKTMTVTGNSVDTRWGPVQVRITVTSGKVTAASAVVFPQENPRDQQINSYAIPALNQEAIKAGSAKIDMISGATYTSDGYIGSLQSALTKAGL